MVWGFTMRASCIIKRCKVLLGKEGELPPAAAAAASLRKMSVNSKVAISLDHSYPNHPFVVEIPFEIFQQCHHVVVLRRLAQMSALPCGEGIS